MTFLDLIDCFGILQICGHRIFQRKKGRTIFLDDSGHKGLADLTYRAILVPKRIPKSSRIPVIPRFQDSGIPQLVPLARCSEEVGGF